MVFTPAAAKDLGALQSEDRDDIEEGLDTYAMTGRGDVKRLRSSDFIRPRIGRYRVIFAEDATSILAIYIGKGQTTTYKWRS